MHARTGCSSLADEGIDFSIEPFVFRARGERNKLVRILRGKFRIKKEGLAPSF